MEIGIYTFVENTPDPATGRILDPARRLRDLVEEARLADEAGLDVFGVGEHHRPDFLGSAPAVILAAAAARTKSIRLTSAVTVLSSDDLAVRANERLTWSGRHRAPLQSQGVYPRTRRDLPIWIAVGGNPPSAVRAGMLNLPMALAIIGGMPERFAPFVHLFREAARESGHDPAKLPVGINTHGYVAETSQRAADEFFPSYAAQMTHIGRERGWPPTTREHFDAGLHLRAHLAVGSPEQVIEKILYQHEKLGHRRYLMQMSVGTMPHAQTMRSIDLFGAKVAPAVRKAVARRSEPAEPAAGRP
jgi:alkanesulfonate monooxygenase SsuD/methylene tetrahydromethanopterin reductase-like flavin-dependent oxidoreductase (luciferase family)